MSAFIVAPAEQALRCSKCGAVWAVPGLHEDCDGEDFVAVTVALSASVRLVLRGPLPPHADARLWRAMMSGLAHTYRHYTEREDHEAALRSLVNAVFCNRRAVRLEKGQP